MRTDRTLLVTGGAGFIGSHFVARHLKAFPGDRVIVLDALTYAASPEHLWSLVADPGRVEFVHGNVRSPTIVDSLVARADAVVHFAAETHVPRSISDALLFVETDVLGTQMLLAAAVRHRPRLERFVHVSSSEVYGTASGNAPMDEAHPLEPCTPYAAAKCGADRLVSAHVRTYDLPAVIVRPFNNYGPGQHLEKLVPRLVTSALSDEPLTIHGDGSTARDWIYVEDTCRALDAVLEAPIERVRGEVFNVGTGVATDVLGMARSVLERTGRDEAAVEHTPERPGQVSLQRADTRKSAAVLGFEPRVALAEGITATVAWYDAHRDWWARLRWMRSVPVTGSDGRVTWW